jgi:phosphatidylserine/phosphatidylglycerophosphate/cardiolipin synthase-like enzyme
MRNKKELIYLAVIIILIGLCGQFWYSYKFIPSQERDVKVYYNQDHELNKEIIQLTRDADKFVYFAVYTFTRQDIKEALLAAKYRGLDVRGITDRDQYNQLDSQKKLIDDLRKAGIPVSVQDHLGIMHLKVIVTDKGYASGSYNWTSAATNLNDEVLEVGHDEKLRASFQAILEKLLNLYQAKQ